MAEADAAEAVAGMVSEKERWEVKQWYMPGGIGMIGMPIPAGWEPFGVNAKGVLIRTRLQGLSDEEKRLHDNNVKALSD